jgi:hypothetical protein
VVVEAYQASRASWDVNQWRVDILANRSRRDNHSREIGVGEAPAELLPEPPPPLFDGDGEALLEPEPESDGDGEALADPESPLDGEALLDDDPSPEDGVPEDGVPEDGLPDAPPFDGC